MIATDETKYRKGESVKLVRGGHGVVVDVFTPPSYLDEPKYLVGFADGQIFSYHEKELMPYPRREKHSTKYELDIRNDSCCLYTEVERTIVEEIMALWLKDGLRLCNPGDKRTMRLIADYLHEYEIITLQERNALYKYLGIG